MFIKIQFNGKCINRPRAIWETDYADAPTITTGCRLLGLYEGRGYRVGKFHSIWNDGTGKCVGEYYAACGDSQAEAWAWWLRVAGFEDLSARVQS